MRDRGHVSLAFTAPAFTSSPFHVTHVLADDWSVRGTWARAARGGAGLGGRRVGPRGGAGGGWFGAGAVGSRQINMESIFHEKVSVRVRWGVVCRAVAAVGRGRAASRRAGGGPSRPHPSLAGREELLREGSFTDAPTARSAKEAGARGVWGSGRPGSWEGARAGPGTPRGHGRAGAPNGLASALPFHFPWASLSSPVSPRLPRL